MNIKNIKLGSDPEFFLRNKETGEMVSSIGIIPGTKEKPLKLPELGEFYTVQIDNVLGEISVDPSDTIEGLWDNIQLGLQYIRDNFLPDNIEIYHASSGVFTEEQLDNDIARTFGCSPSMNAWSERENPAPNAGKQLFRPAGTHIHISYDNPSISTSFAIGRIFDIFCTVPSLFLDTDELRRKFYGRAGEVRIVDYGVECRQLGGFLLSDKEVFNYILNNLYKGIEFLNSGGELDKPSEVMAQFAINAGSMEAANDLIAKYGVELLQQIKA